MPKTIEIKCTSAKTMPLAELEEFQGDLKELSKVGYRKLRSRIERLGFDAPIFVWKGHNSVLDGTQRLRVLREMTKDGWRLKDGLVPVDEIEAATEEEAKERLLGFVSQFGKLTDEGLYSFIQGLDLDLVLPDLDLPNFNMNWFKEGYLGDVKIDEREIDEDSLRTERKCPRCGYEW